MDAPSIRDWSRPDTDIHNMEHKVRVGLLQNGRGVLCHGRDIRYVLSQMDANVRLMDVASIIGWSDIDADDHLTQ